MKTRILLLTTLAAMLAAAMALSGVASATHSTTDNPPRDLASGSGSEPVRGRFVAFSAVSGPSGENAHGHFRIETSSGLVLDGRVTCLATRDNIAVVGGQNPQPGLQSVFIVVEDNGTASEAEPDGLIVIFATTPATQEGCERVFSFLGGTFSPLPIDQGNFTVHDAPPAEETP
jgi:hypothetical protein